jgi:cytochrome oxidase assembly protein ShyY1
LQYAITWYALAVALAAIYIRFLRRRVGEQS